MQLSKPPPTIDMKFRIKLNGEWVLDAVDEEDAKIVFFENIVYDTQSDPASFLEEHLKVVEAENGALGGAEDAAQPKTLLDRLQALKDKALKGPIALDEKDYIPLPVPEGSDMQCPYWVTGIAAHGAVVNIDGQQSTVPLEDLCEAVGEKLAAKAEAALAKRAVEFVEG